MAPSSLLVTLLACAGPDKDTGPEPCVSSDPCDCGVAWTERQGPVARIQDAVDGAEDGETIFVCEGEVDEVVYIPGSPGGDVQAASELSLVGMGADRTFLSRPPPEEQPLGIVLTVWLGATVRVSDLTIAGGTGQSRPYGFGYDRVTLAGGLWLCGPTLSLENVKLTGNIANLGGAFATWCGGNEGFTDITLVDSSVTDNSGRGYDEGYYGGGGAWLTDNFRLTSVNTDWGTGATDNLDDDIAIGPMGGPFTTYADFGAAENFVCSSETQACTRTE